MYKLPSRPPATNEGLIASQLLSDAIPGQDASPLDASNTAPQPVVNTVKCIQVTKGSH